MSTSVSNEEGQALLEFFGLATVGRNPYDGVHLIAERYGISTTTACSVERVLRRAKQELDTINDGKAAPVE